MTPYGDIPWTRLSRFNDDEMRALMKEVVDKIYAILLRLEDTKFLEDLDNYGKVYTRTWDAPIDIPDLNERLRNFPRANRRIDQP
jgi:hypothetical protein